MNGRQIFSIHIVWKCQRSSEARTFARLQYFCTFVVEIKDRMQYCMEEPKRGCRARALSIGTRLLYALRAALRAARAGVITCIHARYYFQFIAYTCVKNSLNKHSRYAMATRFHVESPSSHRLSHPPFSIESPASRRKIWVLRKAILTRSDRPLLYHKLALSNACSHAKNHNDLCPVTWSKAASSEVGFSAVAILGGGWLQSPASDGPPW